MIRHASLILTPTLVRRLFIMRQLLAGPRLSANTNGIMCVARELGCLQLDPTSAVARSHLLVLWSRLGNYSVSHLDQLLWDERRLFEYWAHCASIVLTEDYPLYHLMMRNYPRRHHTDVWEQRVCEWLTDNASLRRYILTRLRKEGPLLSRQLEAEGIHPKAWVSSGWTAERNVSRMLDFLWMQGKIMVTKRVGGQKQWDLAERCLPAWTPRDQLDEYEVTYRAAQQALRALGVATAQHIKYHFIRGRYPHLNEVLTQLVDEGRIVLAAVRDKNETWKGAWFIHADDVPLLESLRDSAWQSAQRTTLLSPFDNLICDRARTEQLFDFNYRVEIYVPASKRQYGYFAMPILHGDRLIGRIDPTMNREQGVLTINAVYAEDYAPMNRATAIAVRDAIAELAQFLGAHDVVYAKKAPAGWAKWLR
jgi:uncharacterized protein YcaQ